MSNSTYSIADGLNTTSKALTLLAGSSSSTLSVGESAEDLIKKGIRANVEGGKEIFLKAKDGVAELSLSATYATLANNDNGFEVSSDGCIVAGPTDFTTSPHQIRIGGFWILNEELLTTVPSTLFNPVQTLLYKDPPAAKRAGKLAKILAGL